VGRGWNQRRRRWPRSPARPGARQWRRCRRPTTERKQGWRRKVSGNARSTTTVLTALPRPIYSGSTTNGGRASDTIMFPSRYDGNGVNSAFKTDSGSTTTVLTALSRPILAPQTNGSPVGASRPDSGSVTNGGTTMFPSTTGLRLRLTSAHHNRRREMVIHPVPQESKVVYTHVPQQLGHQRQQQRRRLCSKRCYDRHRATCYHHAHTYKQRHLKAKRRTHTSEGAHIQANTSQSEAANDGSGLLWDNDSGF